MFANTLTMTVLGADRVLTRVNNDKFSSNYRYRSAAVNLDLTIRHTDRPTTGKVGIRTERHNVELTVTTFTVVDGVNVPASAKYYFVVEVETGQDPAAIRACALSLNSLFVTAEATWNGLLNWES